MVLLSPHQDVEHLHAAKRVSKYETRWLLTLLHLLAIVLVHYFGMELEGVIGDCVNILDQYCSALRLAMTALIHCEKVIA
jgi:hypothetical protein